MRRLAIPFLIVGYLASLLNSIAVAQEDGALPSVSQRFATADSEDIPDFQRHVSPMLGRLGCNGRSCHGSFQGQGGFQLSLFGYDFSSDHKALLGDSVSSRSPRTRRSDPDKSLLLRKPLNEIDHEGGERFSRNSWPYHLLRRWITTGAPSKASPETLAQLEVYPSEVLFSGNPETVPLKVIAVWENGDREDVTPLCRFRTNDESVVAVDEDGRLSSTGEGDTHVIVFYDNGVFAVPVLRAYSRGAESTARASFTMQSPPSSEAENPIDQYVLEKLRKLHVEPSEISSDAQFLRRLSLDLTGTLPEPKEIESFIQDKTPEKRLKKIDELLSRPTYAAWWANKLCDFTGCNPSQQAELGQETSVQWYMWMYERIRENRPYDEIARRIILAESRGPLQSYDDYAREMSSYYDETRKVDFSTRESMPHYWTRRSMRKPDQAAEAFAHNFLGIKLQCAQCHKHPFAPWTNEDYKTFSKFFERVKFGVSPESHSSYQQLAQQIGVNPGKGEGTEISRELLKRAQRGQSIPWRELYVATQPNSVSLDLLRSGEVTIQGNQDPREPIMAWMSDPKNPYFATAFVNRVWAGYFHQGIIDPPDDLNPANPPSNPSLLKWLAEDFVANGFDMKRLHKTIVSSQTYQRTWVPNPTNREDRRNYSRAVPRRMPAEVVYDCVKQALASNEQSNEVRTDLTRRASGHLSMRLAGTYAMQVFGKPDRAVNCDCERVDQPSLLQTIFLQNDPMMDDRLQESGWLKEIEQMNLKDHELDAKALIREAWLRTLCRYPSAEELSRAEKHLEVADSVSSGVRDLIWALLNTKEFLLIH